MNKINKFINKNTGIILIIFVLLQPVIDVLTSICINFDLIISIGVIVRVMFILFTLYYLIFIQKLYRKKYIILIGIIFIYSVLYLINCHSFKDIYGLFKTFYFPISFITILSIYKNNNIVSKKVLISTLLIYISLILIAILTNTAHNSYQIAKVGSVGWFISANEIGAIIALLIPLLFNSLYKKFDYFKLILLIFTIVISFVIGTRIPLISIAICIIVYYFKILINLIKKRYTNIFIYTITLTLIILISFIIILPKTPIYKNIIIHSNYLKIDSIDDIFKSDRNLDQFIFSGRLSYLKNTNKIYNESNINNKIFGIGYTTNEKMIEMDIFDIFYRHGIIGFIVYFMTVIYLLIDMCDKKISKDYILSIIMIIFAMLLSGHVLTSPNVSLFVVLILLNFITYKENMKKKILFTAFDLGVGGIEKCLTNLVNKLDNKKYDIDILLQIHNGIFIDNVNNNVNISDYKLSKSKNKIVKLISNLFKFIKLMILNYDKYDYSFCYATGYVPSAIMGLIGSNNNAIWIHTNVVEYMKYYEPYKNKNWDNSKKVKKFLNRIFARFYKKKIFVSYDGMESYLKINPKDKNKCLVIYNIIDYDDIIKKSNEKIEDIKFNSDEKILLNVGRHTEYDKKLSRIFSAIEKLKNEKYKFKFVFVGDGPMHDEYVKMAKDKNIQDYVIFTGIKKNPYPYYKIADAIVLSSSFEGFPTIYLESIILDKVIITTDVSDARSVVENKYGIVVENNDDSIYNGIKKYLDEGFSVKDKFDVNKYNNTSIQLLESVINNEI